MGSRNQSVRVQVWVLITNRVPHNTAGCAGGKVIIMETDRKTAGGYSTTYWDGKADRSAAICIDVSGYVHPSPLVGRAPVPLPSMHTLCPAPPQAAYLCAAFCHATSSLCPTAPNGNCRAAPVSPCPGWAGSKDVGDGFHYGGPTPIMDENGEVSGVPAPPSCWQTAAVLPELLAVSCQQTVAVLLGALVAHDSIGLEWARAFPARVCFPAWVQ